MAIPEKLKSLVDQMPDADSRGMFNTGIDRQKIEAAVAEIHKGGPALLLGLIEMLVPPGEGNDVKAHYALHCVANHVLKIRDEVARREFGETLAGQLGGNRPKAVQAYLCQELQWAGRREATAALGRLLLDNDLVEPATMALVAIRDGAVEQFRAALPQAKGKCRLNVVQALATLADASSVPALREALADPDREVRIAAGWGLAQIGDEGSVDPLLKAADVAPGWERIQATKHCLVLAEKLAAADRKAQAAKIYRHLRDTRTDPSEKYLRDLAQKALA
jgi:HEAT repeat protein